MTSDEEILTLSNFDNDNIESIRTTLLHERTHNEGTKKVYTLVQSNAPCSVNVKKSSRQKCVAALLK